MDWQGAYSSLANAGDFSESEFIARPGGRPGSLRNYATLESFHLTPLQGSAEEAEIRANLRWSTVVGTFLDVRELRVIRNGDRWQVQWPLVKDPQVPPQVIPVNYLRWDVIYRGPGDDWGTQDVESPHVRIVDMHPVDRGGGAVILGELLNEDVVPAFVTVKATLLGKDGHPSATEDSFDKISHVLLPKQVTPFRIDFHDVRLSQVDSVHLEPTAILIAASADPVIEIEGQRLHPLPDPSLSGALVNQSGQVASIAHVLGTFYDSRGQLVWVSDQYLDRALLPRDPDPIFHSRARRSRRPSGDLSRSGQHLQSGPIPMTGRLTFWLCGLLATLPLGVRANRGVEGTANRGGRTTVLHSNRGGRQSGLLSGGAGAGASARRATRRNHSFRSRGLRNAGHYVALLVGSSAPQRAEIDVLAAAQPANLSFLAKPSRLPVDLSDGISGVVYVFDDFRNLVLEPLPVSFELSAVGLRFSLELRRPRMEWPGSR